MRNFYARLCNFSWGCLSFCLLIGLAQLAYCENLARTPPANTTELIGEEITLFDLYSGDIYQGTVLVTYTDSWCRIEDIDAAIEQLPRLKEEAPVRSLSSGQLPLDNTSADAGRLICDPNSFRLVYELSPRLLFGQEFKLGETLPTPEKKFSMQQFLGAAASGEVGGRLRGSLSYDTVLSLGNYWSSARGSALFGDEEDEYQLDELSADGILEGFEVNAGLLRTEGQFFAASKEFAGIGIRTSEDIILDRELLRGSKLEIYVPSRARVDFFRGQRLLSTQTLNFGLQEVDTSTFPQGSYDIEVVIREDNGRETRERHFFTKNGLLGIRNKPIIFAQAGLLREKLSVTEAAVYQLGALWRAGGALQLEGSVYGSSALHITELEALAVYRNTIARLGFLTSNENDIGVKAGFNIQLWKLNLNIDYLDALSGLADRFEEPFDPALGSIDEEQEFEALEEGVFDVFSRNQNNLRTSLSLVEGDFTLRYLLNRSKSQARQGVRVRETHGPTFRWNFYRDTASYARYEFAFIRTKESNEYRSGLIYSERLGDWHLSAEYIFSLVDEAEEHLVALSGYYDNRGASANGTKIKLGSESTLREVEDREDHLLELAHSAEVNHKNNLLEVKGSVRDSRIEGGGNSSIGLDLQSSFVMSQDGVIGLASRQSQESLLIVDIKGASSLGDVEVIIDGRVKETTKPGKRVIIGLQPYEAHRVGIRPATTADLVTYDTEIHTLVPFPGNVFRKEFKVDKVVIGFGRVVNQAGLPLTWRRIRGLKEYAVTDSDGNFQVEMARNDKLYIELEDSRCELNISPSKADVLYLDFGTISCK